ncbi:YjaG family protein [Salinivibrio kushneri]|uniref:DUF416 family protein n=1 Tax=Salinivibrio kushneri TaxID=1908198 RepID=A0AB36K430_9GAMM|nr:DUF416 family protein [Salinivibrio kushneri]OOE42019.1 hypothetical protein BZG09_14945 [Salinivibrio kushneri]OOE42569.1 hypothetical protein BZG06_12740 [Salinivibrio kushneri]OOE52272.1 hypothetical protein BZG11_05045 [Salinivibrio kushneri]OOE55581.1 hypothetical protein BZG10_02445 [Salinivibrio kushneri]
MLRNPLQLRLEKCENWQHISFMAALVERMVPNYALYCAQTEFADPQAFRNILDAVWESQTVKSAKIDFERQLEKLEPLIPVADEDAIYLTYPAIDACIALSQLLHALLDRDEILPITLKVSQQSIHSVAQLEEAQTGEAVTDENQKTFEAVCEEWDAQWAIFRVLKSAESRDVEMIKSIRQELREAGVSNLGLGVE